MFQNFLCKSLPSDPPPQAWKQIQVIFPPLSAGDSEALAPLDHLNRATLVFFRKIAKYLLLKGLKRFSTLTTHGAPLPKLLCTQNWSYFNLLLTQPNQNKHRQGFGASFAVP